MKQENGMLTTDEEEQAKLIADHFKKIFFKGSEQYKKIAPMKMKRQEKKYIMEQVKFQITEVLGVTTFTQS